MRCLCSVRGTSALLLVAVIAVAPMAAGAQEDAAPEATAESGVEAEGDQLIVIAVAGGFGKYNETTVEQDDTVWSAGLAVWWQPDSTSKLYGNLRFSGYERQYVQAGVGRPGQPPLVVEDELRIGGEIYYAYNVLEQFGMDGWIEVGWRHDYFTNDRFSNNLAGVLLGAAFEYPITSSFALGAFVNYTYNLLSLTDIVDDTALSFTGDILSSLRFGGGFRFTVAGVTTVGVGYLGEHLPYDFTDLLFHQAVLEVGIPIRF